MKNVGNLSGACSTDVGFWLRISFCGARRHAARFAAAAFVAVALAPQQGIAGEAVFVKYRGWVDLTGFDCRPHNSSIVWRTCYLPGDEYVVVNLKGVYYHYCLVPKIIVDIWRRQESMGSYYLRTIKGHWDCRLGGAASNIQSERKQPTN